MHTVVCDLGFGDGSKGATVDWLCRSQPIDTVIRVGAAQAAHNVVLPNGNHHTFAQFGSGMFTERVRTHLSRFMLVDPLRMMTEGLALEAKGVPDVMERTTIDPEALVITPFHAAYNKMQETARGEGRHGSCGIGVGATQEFALKYPDVALRAGDLGSTKTTTAKLYKIRQILLAGMEIEAFRDVPSVGNIEASYSLFCDMANIVGTDYTRTLLRTQDCVIESSQGVLLDEWRGFHPHTTWSTTTFDTADLLLEEADQEAFHLGVLRTYTTRHGAGPFPTEDAQLTEDFPEPHNKVGKFQGGWRVGHFDAVALRYAIAVAGRVDGLALSHIDKAQTSERLKVCSTYVLPNGEMADDIPVNDDKLNLDAQEALVTRFVASAGPVLTDPEGHWADLVEDELDRPVVLGAFGPTWMDRVSY